MHSSSGGAGGSSSSSTTTEISKAAAWMWHMHGNTSTPARDRQDKPPHPADYAIWERKTRSPSFDRTRDSRFRQQAASVSPPAVKPLSIPQEAASASATVSRPPSAPAIATRASSPSERRDANVWDCGSKLYDTFELVSFSEQLDRSLLGISALDVPAKQSPLHHSAFANVLRTFSLPHAVPLRDPRPSSLPHAGALHDPRSSSPPIDVDNDDHGNHAEPSNVNQASSAPITNNFPPSDDQQHRTSGMPMSIGQKLSASQHSTLMMSRMLSMPAKMLKKGAMKFWAQMQCFRPCTQSHDKSAVQRSKPIVHDNGNQHCVSNEDITGIRADFVVGDEDRNGVGISEHQYRAYEETVNEAKDGKHFHHHHHHYHHHFLHHLEHLSQAAREDTLCKLAWTNANGISVGAAQLGQRTESDRLSSDTLSKICVDVNWL